LLGLFIRFYGGYGGEMEAGVDVEYFRFVNFNQSYYH